MKLESWSQTLREDFRVDWNVAELKKVVAWWQNCKHWQSISVWKKQVHTKCNGFEVCWPLKKFDIFYIFYARLQSFMMHNYCVVCKWMQSLKKRGPGRVLKNSVAANTECGNWGSRKGFVENYRNYYFLIFHIIL